MQISYGQKVSQKDMLEEFAIINRAKQDPAQFKPLYEKYYESIYRFIYNRIEDEDQAHDITADVFFKAITKLSTYKYQQLPFSSWLYRIARNELIDSLRKNKRSWVVSINSVKLNNMMDEIEVDHNEKHHSRLVGLIAGLEGDDLFLIEMRFFDKKSFKEISEILSVTEAGIKMRLYRLLEKMKTQLLS